MLVFTNAGGKGNRIIALHCRSMLWVEPRVSLGIIPSTIHFTVRER